MTCEPVECKRQQDSFESTKYLFLVKHIPQLPIPSHPSARLYAVVDDALSKVLERGARRA